MSELRIGTPALNVPVGRTTGATAQLAELQRPGLSPNDLRAGASAAADLSSAALSDVTRRMVEGTPLAGQELTDVRRAVAATDGVGPPPSGVPAMRQWLQGARPVLDAAKAAAFELRQASFFTTPGLDAESKAATSKVNAFADKVQDVEERAGLRRPVAPADPNRPLGQNTRAVAENGGLLRGILGPLARVVDAADAVSRPLEHARYSAAQADYEKRLAAYENARKLYPVGAQ
ncbi:MAG: hypothetical protein ACO3JL_13665 [Myxococcota bacterium]